MTIRIDPGLPIVWRTPHLIQIGVDEPTCVLPADNATEHILAALVAGVPPGALEVIAEHAGAAPGLLETVMHAVAPALLPADADSGANTDAGPAGDTAPTGNASPTAPLVLVDGAAADGLRPLLGDLGMRTIGPGGSLSPDAVVLPASFVVSPARYVAWLSRDVPQLPIVFGDRYVDVGPLVEPGAGPCLRCLSMHRRDADPAWPALSVQLDGRPAATVRPIPTAAAVAHAARMLDDLLIRGEHTWGVRSIRIDAASGAISERAHLQHPECGCRALPGNVTALRPRSAARVGGPNSAAAAAAPG